jgi:hypothetical protein
MPLIVARQQPHSSAAVPELERIRLVLALMMRTLDLEDYIAGRDDLRGIRAGKRLFKPKIALRHALVD